MNPYFKLFIKAVIAIILFCCLLKMPYSYYNFVRFSCFLAFGFFAYNEFQEHKYFLGVLLLASAILFNPFAKIHFKRDVWSKIDLGFAIALIIWAFFDIVYLFFLKRKNKENVS